MKVFKLRKGSKNSFFNVTDRAFVNLKELYAIVSGIGVNNILIIDWQGYDITKEVLK